LVGIEGANLDHIKRLIAATYSLTLARPLIRIEGERLQAVQRFPHDRVSLV
jgi:hypothetical protein